MRGKVNHLLRRGHADRITPAHAGKSSTFVRCPAGRWDHSRVCGEKRQSKPPPSLSWGSPPRMQGKEVKALLHFNRVGITPAHAGKSMTLPSIANIRGDHPRVCGEKIFVDDWLRHILGSPPHMRGKGNDNVGICRNCRDHPRTCGEKSPKGRKRRAAIGSPPHMRGKVPDVPVAALPQGITPAHAGKREMLVEPV